MEKALVNPIDELLSEVDLFNRAGEYTGGKGPDHDISSLVKVLKVYKNTIETMYGRRLLHSNSEELSQELIDDAWYAETQAREIAINKRTKL